MAGLFGGDACFFSGGPRRLPGFPQALLLFTESLGGNAEGFGEPPVLLGVLTFILCPFAHALCVLPVLFRWGGDLSACGSFLTARANQSCRRMLRRDVLTLSLPLYSMNPSRLNLFMKKFTRVRVTPIISASVSCEIFGKVRWGLA